MFTNDDVTDDEVFIAHVGQRRNLAWDTGDTTYNAFTYI